MGPRTRTRPGQGRRHAGLGAEFRASARAQGISDATLDAAFRDVTYQPEVVRRSQNQAEFKKSLWEYLETPCPKSARPMAARHWRNMAAC